MSMTPPQHHDVDAAGGHVQVAAHVGARVVGDRDDAIAATRTERHEHAQAEREHPEVGVGNDAVVQVVDRHDALEAPPRRRRVGEAVDELHARPARQPGQQLLLAAHPLHSAAGVDGDLDHVADLVPGPARRARLAADERRQPQLGALASERPQQLARVDLHAALLAGDEEDEVQADVHRA
jgi:hypothetical protein